MTALGLWNALKILRVAPEGAWLEGGEDGQVRLPKTEVPPDAAPGQVLPVFVQLDETGQAVATRTRPLAERGEVAHLRVVSMTRAGAFLAWGLPKDLFLPWREVRHEQRAQLREGRKALVILYLDEEDRLNASMRLEEFLDEEGEGFKEGDQVSLVIGERTDLGVKVIVDHRCWGLVHESDIFGPLKVGERRDGWVKALRADRKLNLALQAPGYAKIDALAQAMLDTLKAKGGFLKLTDRSRPEEIYATLAISKKVFKQTLGALYKAKRVAIEPEGIRLIAP